MKFNPLTTLREVRQLLNDPTKWTIGAPARDHRDKYVPPTDPSAICWCLMGACWKFGENIGGTSLGNLAIEELEFQIQLDFSGGEDSSAAWFNDTSSHQAILNLLDYTIARLQAPSPANSPEDS